MKTNRVVSKAQENAQSNSSKDVAHLRQPREIRNSPFYCIEVHIHSMFQIVRKPNRHEPNVKMTLTRVLMLLVHNYGDVFACQGSLFLC